MITFGAHTIKCGELHGPFLVNSPDARNRTTRYFGVHGESVIKGGIGGRDISFECWIFDETWEADGGDVDLLDYLKVLEALINEDGTLSMAGTVTESYDECQLREVNRDPELTPRIDEVGALVPGKNVWWSKINLKFRQLKVK